jgi:hypothetical protein
VTLVEIVLIFKKGYPGIGNYRPFNVGLALINAAVLQNLSFFTSPVINQVFHH